jgi:Bifunctional DNA primase/polymerase, N-terminal/AAA domain
MTQQISPTQSNGSPAASPANEPVVNQSPAVYTNTNPTFTEIALPWAARGFKVIPVARGAKRPVWTGWPQIAETETVEQMQKRCDLDWRHSRWNAGLMADPQFHCVLDCDSPGLVEEIERETGRKVPETLTVKSAGKGCPHFYFLPTPKSRELNNKSATTTEGHSFDFWVWHQQTLAPGSIKEPSGNRYELTRDVPMVPIPDWLVDWIAAQHRAHSDASGDADAGALGRLKDAYKRCLNPEDMYNIEGLEIDSCQHPTIHSLGCYIWDGERTEEQMVEILETVWNLYCSREFEQAKSESGLSEIERIVQNVMEKEPCQVEPYDMPSFSAWPYVFNSAESLEQWYAKQKVSLLMSPRQLREREMENGATEQLVNGLLPRHGVNVAVGDSNIGKSPLVVQLAVCVAAGVPYLGRETKQGNAVLLDFENTGMLYDMIAQTTRAVGADPEVVEKNLAIVNRDESATFDSIIEAVKDADLIVVDSFRYLTNGDEKNGNVVMPIMRKLGAQKNCWLLVHHIRKGEQQESEKNEPLVKADSVIHWLERASGHRSIINQSTNRWAIDERGGIRSDLLIRVSVKGRGEPAPVHLNRVFEGEQPIGYEVAKGAHLLTEKQQSIFAAVMGKTLSWDDIVAAAGGGKSAASRFLAACRAYGLAKSAGGAHSFAANVEGIAGW